MSTEGSSSAHKPKTLLVYSSKSPEEARIFDLRGSDIRAVWEPIEEEKPVSPDEWGITDAAEDGTCKYCQLMLHPNAPKVTVHQPNIQSLITSSDTCQICGWIQVSAVRGAPELAQRYHAGDPALCDPNSTAAGITVTVSNYSNFTRLIPVVGPRGHFADSGVPLNSSTLSRLGDLASRRFWHYKDDDAPPHARLGMLKSWLTECFNHEGCAASLPGKDGTVLPTRVLDLTGSPDVPSSLEDVKIKIRETSLEETGSYIALSYCWGADPEHHFKMTRATLDEYKTKIDYASLPMTQREAILVALYLGIRYLWIDSLCIIQDSVEDWEVEAARMSSVYSNSLLTLAATSANGPQDGVLLPFQGAQAVNLNGETVMVRLETHTTVNKASEPLNTRGWTLQEAVLSPRLVCFGSEQWLWKCPSRYATEDGLVDRPQSTDESLNQWAGIVRQGPGDGGRNYFRHWYRLASNYSRRDLTYQTDKLQAIAGLADIFAEEGGYQYVAGLWKEDLAAGLLWGVTSRGAVRHAGTIPSWSWASVEGPVLFNDISERSTTRFKLLDVEQQWEGVPLSSQLKLCRLTVSGMLIQATLGPQSLTQKFRYHILAAPESKEILGEAFLDSILPIEQGVTDVRCLLVSSTSEGVQDLEHFVLILVPAADEGEGDENKAYKRVGMGVVWKKSRFDSGERQGNEAFVEIPDTRLVLM